MRFAHRSIAVLSIAGAALLAGCSTGALTGDGLDTTTATQGAAPEGKDLDTTTAGEGATPVEEGATPVEEEACTGGLLFDGVTCAEDCTSGVLGDGVTCQDTSALIAQGIPICEEAGLVLRDLQFDKGDYEVCGGGVLEATYLCCPPWPAPPPPLPPPWEGPGCTTGLLGDGVTCEDPTVLKDAAFAICQALGLPLRYFDAASMACGAGSPQATYACCPS